MTLLAHVGASVQSVVLAALASAENPSDSVSGDRTLIAAAVTLGVLGLVIIIGLTMDRRAQG
jgi:hypothetical protein